MRILFTFHFCSTEINDISGVPVYLGSSEHDVLVISSQHTRSLKGDCSSPQSQSLGRTEFYRPYQESSDFMRKPFQLWSLINSKVRAFKPDVVIGFGEFNYKLPLRISRECNIPLLLFLEYLRPDKIAIPMRGKSILLQRFPWLYKSLAEWFLAYLVKNSCGIMFSYFGDRNRIPVVEKYGGRAFYVPWCTDVGEWPQDGNQKDHKCGIYIGSLEEFKNAGALVSVIPLILDHTPTERFIVVGPGAYAEQIMKLNLRYGERVSYIESMPRAEALALIRSAGYGFTPVKDAGLGFIGDCWGQGTPLVALHDVGGLIRSGVDALVASSISDVPNTITHLLRSADIYKALRDAALNRYHREYTARAVSMKYMEVIQACTQLSH